MGRRSDGYHLLQSLFWPLSLADKIEIAPSNHLEVQTCWAPDAAQTQSALPQECDNLVFRAAKSIWGDAAKLKIMVRKSIPIGGGLGGGSSNAAALLRYAIESRQLGIDEGSRLALGLGADVPYFLNPSPCWVEGVGEIRQPLDFPSALGELCFLLVFPPFGVATPSAFADFRQSLKPFDAKLRNPFDDGMSSDAFFRYLVEATNTLESSVAHSHPVIGQVLGQLRTTKSLYSGLSGTGSTCFALFPSRNEAQKTAQDLSQFFRTVSCSSVLAGTYCRPRE